MKTAALLAATSLLLAAGAMAQSAPPSGSVPPPPGINDPGVQPVAPAPTSAAPASAPVPAHQSAMSRGLPSMQDHSGGGKHMTLPQVSVHREGQNEVQEYRRSGMVYMVVVTPKGGIPQTYLVDPDGTRHLQPGQPPVQPVMYKVLEWGKSKPAAAASSATPSGESGH